MDHLRRYSGRIRTHSLACDTMISSHDDHSFALDARQGVLRDACHLHGDVFKHAEASGWLCQLPLASSCSLHGISVEGCDTRDSLKHIFHA